MSDPKTGPDELDVAELDDVAGGTHVDTVPLSHPELVVHEE